jgi:hypothetical protein
MSEFYFNRGDLGEPFFFFSLYLLSLVYSTMGSKLKGNNTNGSMPLQADRDKRRREGNVGKEFQAVKPRKPKDQNSSSNVPVLVE